MRFKALLSSALFISSIVLGHSAQADNTKNSEFLKFSDNQKDWFYSGAFMGIGHAVSQYNEEQGQCIVNYYLPHRDKRRKEFNQLLAKYPNHSPTSMLLAVAFKACGKFGRGH